MADRRRRPLKSDAESESGSTDSDTEVENQELKLHSSKEIAKKDLEKADSEYESAEEDDKEESMTHKKHEEVIASILLPEDVESPSSLIDEEGGEEGIAEKEDVEGEFANGTVLSEEETVDIEEKAGNSVKEQGTNEEGIEDDEETEEEEDEEYVEEERQQGDGEECSPSNTAEKELDFDEDRRNPQYIPKKGTFYEHDDRNSSELPKEKETESVREKKKKRLWLDEGKWGHDRYREDEQVPKSRNELIEAYGYDIRCEDCPPRARRRRRYGRGPSKYERNWKDESAYEKERNFVYRGHPLGVRGSARGRGRFRVSSRYRGNNRKSFASLCEDEHVLKEVNGSEKVNNSENVVIQDEAESCVKIDVKNDISPNNDDFPALPVKELDLCPLTLPESIAFIENKSLSPLPQNEPALENNSVRSQTFENSRYLNKSPAYQKHQQEGKLPPFRGTYRGVSNTSGSFNNLYNKLQRSIRGRRQGNSGRYNNSRECGSYIRPNLAPRLMDKQVRAISSEIERLTMNDDCDDSEHDISEQKKSLSMMNENNGPIMKLKNEDSSSRPKRYSSLRQRSLPEAANFQPSQPTVPQNPPFYDAGYQTAIYGPEGVTQGSQSQPSASPPIINPSQFQTFSHPPTPYQDTTSYNIRMPVTNPPPRLFPQVTLPAGPPIIPPPPTCITPNPGIINFPPPPPPAPGYPQFTYQQFATPPPPPPPVSQTPDMFRGGITYYYPQTQPPPIRHVPQKRVKAAIPIIPPPDPEIKTSDKNDLVSQQRSSTADEAETTKDFVQTKTSAIQRQSTVEVEG